MVRGAFRVWENIVLMAGVVLLVVFAMVREFAMPEIPMKLTIVCFMIMAAAFFPRPIWLVVNWRRLSVHEPFSGIISASDLLPLKNAYNRITTLTFIDKTGEQIEKTFAGGILFMSLKVGEQCEVMYNESYPDEYVVMPAGQANAVTFAVIGVLLEIQLLIGLAVLP